jgi:hypothetical protein
MSRRNRCSAVRGARQAEQSLFNDSTRGKRQTEQSGELCGRDVLTLQLYVASSACRSLRSLRPAYNDTRPFLSLLASFQIRRTASPQHRQQVTTRPTSIAYACIHYHCILAVLGRSWNTRSSPFRAQKRMRETISRPPPHVHATQSVAQHLAQHTQPHATS